MPRRRKLSTTNVAIPSPLSVVAHPISVPAMPLQPCMRMTTGSGAYPEAAPENRSPSPLDFPGPRNQEG